MEIKPINGYEGLYEICSDGTVIKITKWKSGDITRTVKKPTIATNGYYVVSLWKHNKCNTRTIHSLLAEHFIPNPNHYKCINHIDAVKTNNSLDNLEWCTIAHNNRHSREHGLNHDEKKVRCIETGEVYKSLSIAAEHMGKEKYRSSDISAVCRGVRKSAWGYHWEFV